MTKIVGANSEGIKEAIWVLRNKGVVVFPTDTAYGLGGVFDSKKVQEKILKIKNRTDKKFTLISSSLYQVKKFFKLDKVLEKLAKENWPGPYSVVVSKSFAIRVPDNQIAKSLSRGAGKPLIATSANITGKKSLYDSKAVIKEFANQKIKPDLIIDAGLLSKQKPSRIVTISEGKIKVIR